jgi:hypothetical protein
VQSAKVKINLSLNLFLGRKVLSKETVFLLAQVFFFLKRKSVKKALPKKLLFFLVIICGCEKAPVW